MIVYKVRTQLYKELLLNKLKMFKKKSIVAKKRLEELDFFDLKG